MRTILLMDIVIAFFGLYLAFSAFQMKKSGKISSLVVPEEEIKKCRNPKGYISGIIPYMYFFAAVSFVVGLVGILCDVKILSFRKIWTYAELLAFLLALACFVQGMRRTKEKFFS
ncbi:MAG: hypothetical protein MR646_12470 [Agathobacter sp.]|mgnify:FL=1|nr:hypothetical protein [Agathobacter sp.]MDY4891805.1 hypothetical protein [Agathobacter sp.]